ncbi:MAG TPA: efflux transporter outer membrane subunit [Steroidobacteraceae bacterium]|nr:efflux transporter outer membrane subunit [Steroidobacteraceae bacterium]
MTPKFSMLVTAALATVLAGCAVGPDFKRPDPPHAEQYVSPKAAAATTDANPADRQELLLGESPATQWWQFFRSDALDQIVERALASNRRLTAEQWSLAQSQELVSAKAGGRWPQIDATAGIGRQKYGSQFLGPLPKPPPFTYFSIGATVSYSLDFTGNLTRSIEQQRALAEYQQHQVEAAQLTVTGNAVNQALEVASLRAQIATVEALLDRDRENLKLVQLAFDAGSVSRLDVVSAQSQLASDTTLLPPLRQQLAQARHALALSLGTAPADPSLPELDLAQLTLPAQLPVSLPSELARRRPDILAAEAQLHAATAAVGVATSNLYPRIDLTGSTGQQSITSGALFDKASNVWSIASGLVAPIFDGGTLRAEKRAAVDAMRSTAANYEQTVLAAFGQVADSLEALDNGAEQLRAQANAEAAARDTVAMTQQSYKEGNVGVLQVLDAERRYQQARLGYVRAQAQRYMDTAQLMLALGGAGPAAPGT